MFSTPYWSLEETAENCFPWFPMKPPLMWKCLSAGLLKFVNVSVHDDEQIETGMPTWAWSELSVSHDLMRLTGFTFKAEKQHNLYGRVGVMFFKHAVKEMRQWRFMWVWVVVIKWMGQSNWRFVSLMFVHKLIISMDLVKEQSVNSFDHVKIGPTVKWWK